ncbi:MAG: hypothetical protein ACLQVI_02540 [Polyangiaceae bacterium]
MSRAEILEMPLEERDWLIERVAEQRKQEARELQRASKRGR